MPDSPPSNEGQPLPSNEGSWSTIPMLGTHYECTSDYWDSTYIYQMTASPDYQRHSYKTSRDLLIESPIKRKPVTPDSQSPGYKATLPQQRSRRYAVSKRGNSWVLEIAGLVLSSISFIALLAVLFHVNGRPLTQWNFFLSVNAVVSVLAAISRTTLAFSISSCLGQSKWNWFRRRSDNLIGFDRFDDASRGPWGSLWLIIWLRASHWVILGAFVLIILIVFEPFLQAVISFTGRMDPTSSGPYPYIGKSQVLDIGTFREDVDGGTMGEMLPGNLSVGYPSFISQPDLGAVSAFNNGFYNTSTTRTTFFYCPTANCTWPDTTSLAICSSCNDITNHLERRKQIGSNLFTLYSQVVGISNANFTIFALPLINITNLSISYGNKDFNKLSVDESALMAATRITDTQSTLSFQHLETMITAVQVLRAPEEFANGSMVWEETAVTATECALYFCLNTYESVVDRGSLSEKIISSSSNREPESFQCIDDCMNFDEYEEWHNHSLYSNMAFFNRTDLELIGPANDTPGSPENTTSHFRLTQRTIGSTTQFVNNEFFSDFMIWPLYGKSVGEQPPVGQALYYSNNLSETFGNASQVLSNWVRDISGQQHNGTALEWVVHIKVDWAYVSLPVISIVVGLGFCVSCMVDTRRLRLDPWKTDMIATLAHSVDAETRAQLRHANRNGYLRQAVKVMTVKLEDSGPGYELRAQDRD